ncbi:MAG: DNA-processing protein DprA [Acetatifactor sp.]|nr:DNA-processing protein DprA [Acetatifactor sp.]
MEKGKERIFPDGGANEAEHAYTCWLCSLPGVGNHTVTKLLEYFGSSENIYRAGEEELRPLLNIRQMETLSRSRQGSSPEREYQELLGQGIGFLHPGDENYPGRLREIPDAPYGLFYRGKLPEEERLAVAVIGARDCSEYGRYVAAELGRELGKRGVSVISGMARGIDGISQLEALAAGGISFGVLGCGVDICYPKQNRQLYERLLRDGGVLSEYPPGMPPVAQNFPPRNRIVSGLADALVVVEARQKSGTLITVDMALEQGKEVYVVPGRVTDRLSDGCNKLLKQGAGVFLSPEEFLREMEEQFVGKMTLKEVSGKRRGRGSRGKRSTGKMRKPLSELSPELKLVYGALDMYPQSLEQICGKISGECDQRKLSLWLMQLCVLKLAVQVSPGHFQIASL